MTLTLQLPGEGNRRHYHRTGTSGGTLSMVSGNGKPRTNPHHQKGRTALRKNRFKITMRRQAGPPDGREP